MDADWPRFEKLLVDLGLTRREAQVTLGVVRGQLDREIAAALGISRSAVKEFERRAREKLGTVNRAQLAVAAIREYIRGGEGDIVYGCPLY